MSFHERNQSFYSKCHVKQVHCSCKLFPLMNSRRGLYAGSVCAICAVRRAVKALPSKNRPFREKHQN